MTAYTFSVFSLGFAYAALSVLAWKQGVIYVTFYLYRQNSVN
ncbi:hypothetical protein GPAL_3586 [Glaciecola pallidula DSM 14239 = ACAM 615]|uniref:Uncharacterized protein n=1 Tax=Brumicola pallidula DSM 14239 = ACAM 615 TaxID=1121922 RepID=K6ZNG4_9ALTE|nr:hypothetical protein GPAL_3586 [Glaciecola pallidula DSM 14239 = ACAM 615]